ncbi:MAG: Flp pilus assembly protein CpaB [Planctomycetota bacterium]|jgi:pilus assembly protein CpaB
MKWSVTILITLGLLAGLSAAILVKFMRSDGTDDTVAETQVVLVSEDLSPMTILKSSHLTVKSVAKNKLPEGCLTDPVQAVGKILAVPVVKEQMLTESCFVKDGSRAQVAAMLPEGMRAVSLSLSSSSISGGLLYPGCVVDVLASFRLSSSSERGQALSTTLLRSIQVLAVEGDSVVSQKEEGEKKPTTARAGQNKLTVTLMVDPRQAEALQLASGQGTISLALRNPLDTTPVDTEAMVLSQGRLAELGSAMAAAVITDETNNGNVEGNEAPENETIFGSAMSTGSDGGTAAAKPASQKNVREAVNKGKLSWPVKIIRGTKVQQQDLDLPEVKISANVSGSR